MNVLLTLLVLMGVELNTNAGFETDLSGWTVGGNHSGTRITTDKYIGAACMQVVASGAGDAATNRARLDVPSVVPGQSFLVSFAAKSVSGSTSLTLQFGTAGSKTYILTTDWQLYRFEFRDAPAAGNFRWYLNAAGTFNIDAVSVKYYVPANNLLLTP